MLRIVHPASISTYLGTNLKSFQPYMRLGEHVNVKSSHLVRVTSEKNNTMYSRCTYSRSRSYWQSSIGYHDFDQVGIEFRSGWNQQDYDTCHGFEC